MKEQLIKEITEEVVKYVPDIMELKFGCRVLYGKEPHEPQEVIIGSPYIIVDKEVCNPWNLDDRGYLYNIIGRPATLEDILITAKKVINNEPEAFFTPYHIIVSDVVIKSRWQLGKPLHEQSIETLQFIKGIIK